jgi:tetratricopeptide (TPR) repeat protein
LSDNEGGQKKYPRWLGVAIFAGAVVVVLMLSNHSMDTRTPENLYVVADDAAYNQSLQQAHQVGGAALHDYEQGKQLTPLETESIRDAAKLIDQANLYKPTEIGPDFLSGMAHAALGEYEKADEEFRQGILNAQGNTNPKVMTTVTDAHYQRARILFQLKRYQESYDEAAAAIKDFNSEPDYLIAHAKAALQLGKTDEAKQDAAAAFEIDKNNAGAKQMNAYLNPGAKPNQKKA